MEPVMEDELMHYGVKRRSGRYPWGSGDSPFQRSGDFLSRVNDLKKQGMTEKEIVKDLGFESTTQYRRYYTIANNERKKLNIDRAKSLAEPPANAVLSIACTISTTSTISAAQCSMARAKATESSDSTPGRTTSPITIR